MSRWHLASYYFKKQRLQVFRLGLAPTFNPQKLDPAALLFSNHGVVDRSAIISIVFGIMASFMIEHSGQVQGACLI